MYLISNIYFMSNLKKKKTNILVLAQNFIKKNQVAYKNFVPQMHLDCLHSRTPCSRAVSDPKRRRCTKNRSVDALLAENGAVPLHFKRNSSNIAGTYQSILAVGTRQKSHIDSMKIAMEKNWRIVTS